MKETYATEMMALICKDLKDKYWRTSLHYLVDGIKAEFADKETLQKYEVTIKPLKE